MEDNKQLRTILKIKEWKKKRKKEKEGDEELTGLSPYGQVRSEQSYPEQENMKIRILDKIIQYETRKITIS